MRVITHSALMLAALSFFALGALTPAFAQTTVFNTFGAGDSFQTAVGWTDSGPTSIVGFVSSGASFTVSQSGTLFSLTVAEGNEAGTNVGNMYLTDDVSKLGNTGAALESFSFTNLPASGSSSAPEVLTSVLNPTLTVGTTYYLYDLETADTWDAWNLNDQGINGTLYQDQGSGYTAFSGQALPAFSVQIGPASATPEPASYAAFLLGGLGLLGLGLKARRRA